jgi:hypothetical protein
MNTKQNEFMQRNPALRIKPSGALTDLRIRDIIDGYNNIQDRSKLDYYVSFMRIVLENENISLDKWDNSYSDDDRHAAMRRAGDRITCVLEQ